MGRIKKYDMLREYARMKKKKNTESYGCNEKKTFTVHQ